MLSLRGKRAVLVILPLLFVTISDGFTFSTLQPWNLFTARQCSALHAPSLLNGKQDDSQRRRLDFDDRSSCAADEDESRTTLGISAPLWRKAEKAVAAALREGPVPPDEQEKEDIGAAGWWKTSKDRLMQDSSEKKTYFLLGGLDAASGIRMKKKYFMLAGLDAPKPSKLSLAANIEVLPESRKMVDDATKKSGVGTDVTKRIEAPTLRRVENGAVAVFDFDKTLATVDVDFDHINEDAINAVFGGHDRVTMLSKLFNSLKRRGVELAIVSFNTESTVQKALGARGVELLHFFDPALIFGQESFLKYDEMCIHTQDDVGYSKAKFISNFVLPPLPTSPHTLLFVDDRLENIHDVSNYVPGSLCIWIKTERRAKMGRLQSGITPVHCTQIIKWADRTANAAMVGALDREELLSRFELNKALLEWHAASAAARMRDRVSQLLQGFRSPWHKASSSAPSADVARERLKAIAASESPQHRG